MMRRFAMAAVLLVIAACSPKVRWFRPYPGEDGGVGQGTGGAAGQGGVGGTWGANQGGATGAGAGYGCVSDPSDAGDGGGAEPILLVAGEMARGIAVDATHLYWIDSTTVRKMPKEGGAAVILAYNQLHTSSIAIDDTSVYWTDFEGETVNQVAKDGGTPIVLASSQGHATNVLLDAAYIYWKSYNLMKMPKNGGTPFIIATGGGVGVIDSEWAYWKDAMTVWKMPIDGGTPTALASYGPILGSLGHNTMAVDATDVYWTDETNGTVRKVSKLGGSTLFLAHSTSQGDTLSAIAIDADYLYWGSYDNETLFKVPIHGGTSTVVYTGTLFRPIWLALDCTSIYVATWNGNIFRIAK